MKDKKEAEGMLRVLTGLAVALNGPRVAIGIDRIMDGKCPDCGEPIETHNNEERCHKIEEDE